MAHIIRIHTLDEGVFNKKGKATMKNMNYRNAFVRVSATNLAKSDNKDLGVNAGDTITYTRADIEEKLKSWIERKKDIRYYLIEHNEDENNRHFHIVLDFGDTSQARFSTLKKMFPYGDIERCKGGVKNCVRYLVHADQPEKTPYDWDDIVTNAKDKLEGYKIPGQRSVDAKLEYILGEIYAGRIREYEIAEKIEPEIYVRYAAKIKSAFEYREKKVMLDSNREITVIVLQGTTGLGKSTYAKAYAEKMGKKYCLSSASNDPCQDYGGEDVLILDDYNPINLRIEDFMKMIDPHNNASIKSRYRNKRFIGDTIIITTNTDITRWYPRAAAVHRSAMFRRITTVLNFVSRNEFGEVQYEVCSIREYDEKNSRSGVIDHQVVLVPEEKAVFDLGRYIDINGDEKNKKKIINILKEI